MRRALSRFMVGAGAGAGVGMLGTVAAEEDCQLSWDLLRRQDSTTSNEVIRCMKASDAFTRLSKAEGELLVERDAEDEEKLWRGVQISIARGVLEKIDPPAVKRIDVFGKTPEEVADAIIASVGAEEGKGAVVVLQGQSGTGKGTTTATLLKKLPRSVSWSNGNVFRALTLLAAKHCEKEGIDLQAESEKVLTAENVARWVEMLSFEKTGEGKYDIVIRGLGVDAKVSEIQNTVLKEPLVAKNIPTVAEQTQGDVVKFASAALEQMASDGMNVVLEGRAATVQYIPTPHRFELVLKDTTLLGQRRAAQRVMAGVHAALVGGERPTRAEILKKAKSLCEEWGGRI